MGIDSKGVMLVVMESLIVENGKVSYIRKS